MAEKTLRALAAEASTYGFPLVFNLEQVRRLTVDGRPAGQNPLDLSPHVRSRFEPVHARQWLG